MSTSNPTAFIQGSSTTSSQSTTTSIPEDIIIPDSDELYEPLPMPTTTRNRIPRSKSRNATSAHSSRSGSVVGSLPASRDVSVSMSRRVSPLRSAAEGSSSSRSVRQKGKRAPLKPGFDGGGTEDPSAGPSQLIPTREDRVDEDMKGKGKATGKKRQRSPGSEDDEDEEAPRPAPPRRPFGHRTPSIDSIPQTQDSQYPEPPPDSQASAILGPFTSHTAPEPGISARAAVGGSPTFSDILDAPAQNPASTIRSYNSSFTDQEDDVDKDEESFSQPIPTRGRRRSSIEIDEILNGPGASSSSASLWFLNRDDDYRLHRSDFAHEPNPFQDFEYPPSGSSVPHQAGQHSSSSTSTSFGNPATANTNNGSVHSEALGRRGGETLSAFAHEPNPFEDWYPPPPPLPAPPTSGSTSNSASTFPGPMASSSSHRQARVQAQASNSTSTSATTHGNTDVLRRRAESLADLFRDAIGEDHESYITPDSNPGPSGASSSSGAGPAPGPSSSILESGTEDLGESRRMEVWEAGSPFGRAYIGEGSPSSGGGVAGPSRSSWAAGATAAMTGPSGSGPGSSSSMAPQDVGTSAGANTAVDLDTSTEEIEISEPGPSSRRGRRNLAKGKGPAKGGQLATWTGASSSPSASNGTVGAGTSSSSTAAAAASSSSSSNANAVASSSPSSTTATTTTTTTTISSSTTKATLPKAPPPPSAEPLSEYTCPICFFPPTNATITPCGHVCCGECLFNAVKAGLARNGSLGLGGGGGGGGGGIGGFAGALGLGLGGAAAVLGPMGIAVGMGRGRGRGAGAAAAEQANNGALCPVCRAPIPGWDGRGGGVVGLKIRTVISI